MLHGHGDDIFRYGDRIRVNFSSNVWYGADLEGLMRHLGNCRAAVAAYPEPDAAALGERLARRHGLRPGQVCVTNGATEAFYLIAQAWAGSRSVIAVPSFREYEDACALHGHGIEFVSTDALLEGAVELSGCLVWLCNPNNPDGRVIPPQELRWLFESNPRTVFVLDASYAGFTREPLLDTAEAVALGNVITVHSMTKVYGIAGLRLGYLCASEALTARVAAARMPWSVNSLAIEAGHYLLDHEGEFTIPLESYLTECERFRMAIGKIPGVETQPSACHFFTAKLSEGSATELKEYLAREHGLLIRNAANFRGHSPGHFRLAAQRPEENDECVTAIRQWILRR